MCKIIQWIIENCYFFEFWIVKQISQHWSSFVSSSKPIHPILGQNWTSLVLWQCDTRWTRIIVWFSVAVVKVWMRFVDSMEKSRHQFRLFWLIKQWVSESLFIVGTQITIGICNPWWLCVHSRVQYNDVQHNPVLLLRCDISFSEWRNLRSRYFKRY
jgi:hypothetical protein